MFKNQYKRMSSINFRFILTILITFILVQENKVNAQSPGGVSNNLHLWFKADAGTTLSGSEVTNLADQGPNSFDAQKTSGSGPDLLSSGINFNPTLNFDGGASTESLNIPTGIMEGGTKTNMYVYTVCITDVQQQQALFWQDLNTGNTNEVFSFIPSFSNGNTYWDNGNTGTGRAGNSPWGGTLGVPYLWSLGSTTGSMYINRDNNSVATSGDTGSSTEDNTQPFYIGHRWNNSGTYFDGKLSEMIILDGVPTADEENQIQSYLAIKYGITLNAMNYINSSTNTIWTNGGGYDNDIVGIGLDNASGLNQKQSKSINSDAIVTMGLGTIAADNSNNVSTFTADQSYMIWGNDNDDDGTIEIQSSETPSGYTERLDREWLIEETGTVGNVEVKIDLTGLTFIANSESEFRMVIDDNGDFSEGTQTFITPDDLTNDILTFNSIDFSNGDYFTIMSNVVGTGPGGQFIGLQYWVRADSLSFQDAGTTNAGDESEVLQWNDISTNGVTNSRASGTAPTYETTGINFNHVINFDGTTEYMDIDDFSNLPTGTSERSVFMVAKPTATNGQRYAISHGRHNSNNANLSVGINAGAVRWDGWTTGIQSGTIAANETFLWSGRWEGAGGSAYLDKNGENLRTETENWNTLTNGTQRAYLGRRTNNASYWSGDIAEIIYFDKELNNLDKRKVESYLGIRYGITLSADNDGNATPGETISGSITEGDWLASDGSTVIWDYSANTSYYNDIAGIGRDDNGSLNQKQSKSINSDAIVTMGLGTIAVDNSSNATTFALDNSYIIWGNDNNGGGYVDAISSSDMPSGFTSRLNREWKIQETGTVGNVQLTFDLSTVTTNASSIADFKLLIDEDGDGDFTTGTITQISPNLYASEILTFNTVDFDNGQVFTLAMSPFSCGPGGVASYLQLWLKADVGVAGTPVTTWTDQSPNGFDAIAIGNSPDQVTNSINFNPAIDFVRGSSEDLQVSGGIFEGIEKENMFAYIVSSADLNTTATMIEEELASNFQFRIYAPFNGTTFFDFGNATNNQGRIEGAWGGTLNIPNLWSFGSSDNTATPNGTKKYITRDAANIIDSGDPTANNFGTGQGSDFYIGSQSNANFWDGQIGEIIILDGIPTATEEDQIQSYLAIKYGITLGTTGTPTTYLNTSANTIWTGDASYQNNIAGIGRDDTTCLVQKQSKSINSDATLTIGLGTIAVDNASNGNSFGVDQSYMIWGSNGESTSEISASNMPGNYSERIARDWKVQETGTVGNVEVKIDITGLVTVGTLNSHFFLIIDEDGDGDFTTGTIRSIQSSDYTSDILTFNTSVNFANGEYFTVAVNNGNCYPAGISAGLGVWLKANADVYTDAGTTPPTDGQQLQQWNDQGPEGNNATQGTTSRRPVWHENIANFNPSVRFVGAGNETNTDRMNFPNGTLPIAADPGYSFFTSINTDVNGQGRLVSQGSLNGFPSAMFEVGIDGANRWFNYVGTTGSRNIQGGSFGTGTSHVFGTILNKTAGVGKELYGNGLSIATNTNTYFNGGSGQSYIGWTLHDPTNRNRYPFRGYSHEVISYNITLSSDQALKVHSYLAVKYGVTMGDNSDPVNYVNSYGNIIWHSSTSFQNDIASIARDDQSCLSQKQSKSQNTDAIITMALGSIASTNIDNANSFVSDTTALVWGNDNDDNGTIEASNSELPDIILERLDREWLVYKTDNFGTAYVEVDISGIAVTGSTIYDFALLIDSDGDANFTTGRIQKIKPDSYSSNILSFNAIDFNDGDVFTIATHVAAPGGVTRNLQLWLRADMGTNTTTAAADVSSWIDQSMNDYQATDNNETSNPQFTEVGMNYNPTIQFNGTSDGLNLDTNYIYSEKNGLVMYGVVDPDVTDAAKTHQFIMDFGNYTSDGYGLIHGSTVTEQYSATSHGGGTESSNHSKGDTAVVVESMIDFGTSHITTINGLTEITEASSMAGMTQLTSSEIIETNTHGANQGPVTVGRQSMSTSISNNNGRFFDGEVGDVIIYDDELTANELLQIQSHMAIKYGITLGNVNNTKNYVNTSFGTIWTANGTYQNDVAGIGRDDKQALNQLQSKSINSDAVVAIAMNSLASSVATNAGSFSADQSYLVWGNNSKVLTIPETTDIGVTLNAETIEARLQRIWLSEETGTVGTVKIQYDLSGLFGANANDFTDARLLVDVDGVFATGATSIAPSAFDNNAGTVEFDHDFGAGTGFFFTLGSVDITSVPLPILMTNLAVQSEGCIAHISWTTLTERDNNYIVIERSIDGIKWDSVGYVNGAKNSLNPINYHFEDNSCDKEGLIYYRLVPHDIDGSTTYSDIVSTKLTLPYSFHHYPSPAEDIVTIVIDSEFIDMEEIEIVIYSVDGREMLRTSVDIGTNDIDISSIPNAIYIMKLIIPDHSNLHSKLIKYK